MPTTIDFKRSTNIWSVILPGIGEKGMPGPIEIIDLIRAGLPGSTIEKVTEAYHLPKDEIHNLLRISPKTGQRIDSKMLDKKRSDRLIQLVKVFERASAVFLDIDKAMDWLRSPCQGHKDQTPLQLLDTTIGVELVMGVLDRIEYGIFDQTEQKGGFDEN